MTVAAVHIKRTTCRLCGAPDLDVAFSLKATPPANAYVKHEELGVPERCFPLDLYVCRRCHHAQLLDIVDPAVLFRHYVYVSGTSPVMVKHLRDMCADVLARAKSERPFMVEIGSNDGTLLQAFIDKGVKALGIEPAENLAAAANAAGRPTRADFFNAETAAAVRSEHGPAHIICANNVLAHIDALADVFAGIKTLMAPDGLCVFEVSYLVDVIEHGLFDTIYHEHVSYHSVGPMIGFLARAGLELFAAQRVPTQGGSIRFFVQHASGPHQADGSVEKCVAREAALGLATLQPYRTLEGRIAASSAALRRKLAEVKTKGARVGGYGAPAKVTTMMHHFDLGASDVEFLAEDNPLKVGLYTPGRHVPIVGIQPLYENPPEYVVVFAWNFARSIIERHRKFADKGGRFIVPLPALLDVGAENIDQYLASTTH